MKILVADDDRDQLSLRCMLLARSDFETLAAPDAATAVELAAAHRPQCAVLDFRLPTERCGLQLIHDLKTLDPGMHIFVLTGGDGRRLAEAPESKLVDAVVTKGSGCAGLIQKLRTVAAAVEHP
jgi:two-component system, OmpR family, KDP operon response regulator KdpE